ncbi:hypothetical protein HOA91_02025 [Candidatus Woesearchaeota archaeon]|jgi:hypothetical protein|nr:hypothetical protein [Candidatus Woesearchaeota archaeon]
MIDKKFQPGTPQNCVFNNAAYQRNGICDISERLKAIDCIHIDTSRTERREFHDHHANKLVSLLCYGCNYQKED